MFNIRGAWVGAGGGWEPGWACSWNKCKLINWMNLKIVYPYINVIPIGIYIACAYLFSRLNKSITNFTIVWGQCPALVIIFQYKPAIRKVTLALKCMAKCLITLWWIVQFWMRKDHLIEVLCSSRKITWKTNKKGDFAGHCPIYLSHSTCHFDYGTPQCCINATNEMRGRANSHSPLNV